MKQIKILNNEDFEVVSSTDRCIQCKFRYEVILDDVKSINISCRHPRGPVNHLYCMYFKLE